jgi:hypothetical protein
MGMSISDCVGALSAVVSGGRRFLSTRIDQPTVAQLEESTLSPTQSHSGSAFAQRLTNRFILCAIVLPLLFAVAGRAAERVRFPSALHITRNLLDPVSQKTTVIDEYCHGNRVVSVNGSRTAIADYAAGELTEIDFAAGTYSVTKFEQIARVYEAGSRSTTTATAARNEWKVESRGGNVIASRPAETTEAVRNDGATRHTIRVSADRQLTLNRSAIEALLGVGYPYRQDDAGDVVLGALRSRQRNVASTAVGSTSAADEYHLPLEQVVRIESDGETVETRNVVMRIGNELPPADALAIPSGAKLVESKIVAIRRMLEELDRPPSSSPGN